MILFSDASPLSARVRSATNDIKKVPTRSELKRYSYIRGPRGGRFPGSEAGASKINIPLHARTFADFIGKAIDAVNTTEKPSKGLLPAWDQGKNIVSAASPTMVPPRIPYVGTNDSLVLERTAAKYPTPGEHGTEDTGTNKTKISSGIKDVKQMNKTDPKIIGLASSTSLNVSKSWTERQKLSADDQQHDVRSQGDMPATNQTNTIGKQAVKEGSYIDKRVEMQNGKLSNEPQVPKRDVNDAKKDESGIRGMASQTNGSIEVIADKSGAQQEFKDRTRPIYEPRTTPRFPSPVIVVSQAYSDNAPPGLPNTSCGKGSKVGSCANEIATPVDNESILQQTAEGNGDKLVAFAFETRDNQDVKEPYVAVPKSGATDESYYSNEKKIVEVTAKYNAKPPLPNDPKPRGKEVPSYIDDSGQFAEDSQSSRLLDSAEMLYNILDQVRSNAAAAKPRK